MVCERGFSFSSKVRERLNPCFNGIWSARRRCLYHRHLEHYSLNPCFNGIWSASLSLYAPQISDKEVLILILMEYGLRAFSVGTVKVICVRLNPCFNGIWSASLADKSVRTIWLTSLNPCFNGIWSASPLMRSLMRSWIGLNPCFNGIWSARVKSVKICV